MSLTGNLWNAYLGYLDRLRERRVHRQTVNAIESLSPHMLRDIGWPTAYERNRHNGIR